MPIIGEVPGRPHCRAVLGYGGNGITFSRVAADVIYSSIFGSADPDADLFALLEAARAAVPGTRRTCH